jgi:hypothetical protein
LKFVVHAGQYDTQNIGGRTELIGPDIVVAHRLLKNSVPVDEYALLTPAVGDAVGGFTPTSASDSYEDVGTIEYVYFDLAPLREEYERTSQVFIGETDAKLIVKAEIAAPPDVVFRALTDTAERKQWQRVKELDRIQGESGKLGEVHRCIHEDGTDLIHVTVGVDEAGRRHTEKIWIGGWMGRLIEEMYSTLEARPLPDGRTEAVLYGTMVPRIPVLGDAFVVLGARMMGGVIEKDFASLKSYCEEKVRVG